MRSLIGISLVLFALISEALQASPPLSSVLPPASWEGSVRFGGEVEILADDAMGTAFLKWTTAPDWYLENLDPAAFLSRLFRDSPQLLPAGFWEMVRSNTPDAPQQGGFRDVMRWATRQDQGRFQTLFARQSAEQVREWALTISRTTLVRLILDSGSWGTNSELMLERLGLRTDAPMRIRDAVRGFHWGDDTGRRLEFRIMNPVADASTYIERMERLGMALGFGPDAPLRQSFRRPGITHTHFSWRGRDLRQTAALLNLRILFDETGLWPTHFIREQAHYTLNPVEMRGLVRLYDPDRVEVRSARGPRGAVTHLVEAIERPEQYARDTIHALLDAGIGDWMSSLLYVVSSDAGRTEKVMEALSESIHAVSVACATCSELKPNLTRAFLAASADDTLSAAGRLYFRLLLEQWSPNTRLPDLPPSMLDRVFDHPIMLRMALRSRNPRIVEQVSLRWGNLDSDQRWRRLAEVAEFPGLALQTLQTPPSDAVISRHFQRSTIWMALMRAPTNLSLRKSLLELGLRSEEPVIRNRAVQGFSRIARFLTPQEATVLARSVERLIVQDLLQPDAAYAWALSGELSLIEPVLDALIATGQTHRISQEALRTWLESPVAEVIRQRVRASPSEEARRLAQRFPNPLGYGLPECVPTTLRQVVSQQ